MRVLTTLLQHKRSPAEFSTGVEFNTSQGKETSNGSRVADERLLHPSVEGPVAYIASVVRNINTFNYFLALAEQANLVVTDLTEKIKVCDFLPYLRSYDRSTIRIFRIHK